MRHCTHDIPVTLIPRKLWSDFKEPTIQKFDVSIYLPDIKRLKHIAERYKNLDSTVVLRANRNGELRFTLDNQRVTVGTYFKNLETPPFIEDKESKLKILVYIERPFGSAPSSEFIKPPPRQLLKCPENLAKFSFAADLF